MSVNLRTAIAVVVSLAPAFLGSNLLAQVASYAFVARNGSPTEVLLVGNVTSSGTIPVNRSYDIAFAPTGHLAYLATGSDVSIVDVARQTVSGSITVPSVGAIAVSPDGTRAYVGDYNGTISVVDLTTNAVLTTIPTAAAANQLAITPDGSRAYVTAYSSNEVWVYDLSTNTRINTIPVTNGPYGVAILPNGTRAYVLQRHGNGVVPIDLTSDTAGSAVPLPLAPHAISASPDGQRVYVSSDSSELYVIDTSSHAVQILTAFSRANGVAFTPDGRYALVTDHGTDLVSQVVVDSGVVARTRAVGSLDYYNDNSFVGPATLISFWTSFGVASDSVLATAGFGDYLIFNGGTLRATASWTTARRLSMMMNGGTINTAGFNLTVTGNGVGEGSLTKTGSGTLVLSGTNSFTGATTVAGGSLQVNGSLTTSPITVQNGATLGGAGTVGTVTVNAGGTLAPGSSPGILTAGNVSFAAGSIFSAELNGATAGSGYDRLATTGSTALNGATLTVSLGYAPSVGSTFMIATNVTGTFAGLPQGSSIAVGAYTVGISYTGGDGNDAVLTVLSAPVAPRPPTAFPPSITSVGDLSLPVNGSTVVNFSVSGAIIADALQVSVSTSNPLLLPPGSGLVLTPAGNGSWQLAIRGADGRSGSATVTLTVNDGTYAASTTFAVTVGSDTSATPPPPSGVRATPSGSGIVLTWLIPVSDTNQAAITAERFAIAGGTMPGGFDLPVVLTAAGASSYTIPAMPNGTYYFRVHSVGPSGVSDASEEVSVAVTHGGAVPGPPGGFHGSLAGSVTTLRWTPAPGATTISQIEIGSSAGNSDLGTLTSLTPPFTRDVTMIAPGTYWLRARTVSGGAISGTSNDVAVTIADTSCTIAPAAPVLLPVSVREGQATMSWLPGVGAAAQSYRVSVRAAPGGAPLTTLVTTGPVSSAIVVARPGSYAIDVVAENSCGVSTTSNVMTLTIP